MGSIRFGQSNTPIKPEVLNHQKASPLKANNIQLRVDGDYLKDFTPSGIEKFLDKHTGFFDGKKLDSGNVKAFVQQLAQNPEAVKNMTFDLKDPELGLYRSDGIDNKHIEGAFSVDFKESSFAKGSATDVHFIDATSVNFDLKEKEKTVAGAEKKIDTLQGQKKDLEGTASAAEDKFALAQRLLGDGSMEKYESLSKRQTEIGQEQEKLGSEKEKYQAELKKEDLSPARKTEIKHILAGIEVDEKSLKTESGKVKEQLSERKGYVLEKYSLNDLPELKNKVTQANTSIKKIDTQIQEQSKIAEGARGEIKPEKEETKSRSADAKPAKNAPDVDTEDIQVGNTPKTSELQKLPVKKQAAELSQMSQADQKAFVSTLSSEDKAKLQSEVATVVDETKGSSTARTRKSHKNHTSLLETIKTTESKAAEEISKTTTTTTTTTAKSETTTQAAESKAAEKASNVTTGETDEEIPEGGLSRKSKVLKVNGKAVTADSFKTLAIEDKFDILMKADAKHLEKLLRSMPRSERDQIRTLAKQELASYAGAHSNSTAADGTTYSVQRDEDGKASYVAKSPDGKVISTSPISEEKAEGIERASYLIKLIDKINAEEDGTSTSGTTVSDNTTTTTTTTETKRTEVDTSASSGLQKEKYKVTQGQTAEQIAIDMYGSPLRAHEILTLNPELEDGIKARANSSGKDVLRTPLMAKDQKELEIEVLKKGEEKLSDPVITSNAAKPAQNTPKVVVVDTDASDKKAEVKPAAKEEPKVEVKPAAAEKPKVVVVDTDASDKKPVVKPAAEDKPEVVIDTDASDKKPVVKPDPPADKPTS